jgi:hypothetical protein
MKKPLFLQLIIIIIACFSLSLHAQDSTKKTNAVKSPAKTVAKPPVTKPITPPPAPKPVYSSRITDTAGQNINTDKSLSGQYKYLLTKIYGYQQPLLAAFHKSIMDTLVQTRHALRDTNAKLAIANKTIDSLNNGIKSTNQSLTESNAKANAIDFVGVNLPKSTYNLIMWGLVIIFGAAAAVVIARSGSYSREAKYRTQLYNELEEEYRVYKAKANEKEKKLARELQTERNKLDDMLGKSDS